ncbi:hypothetical protein Bhyg_05797 [Pseudolycoriella hygida]|uniref:AB hydrolase-1 domain-containing protein n=1 Tax=Pseudolycoriella hygida TaxID=35572 RepID=A0A9Q0MZN7_9DIPT|nr:hypothetical protein Bhyg_05797 [Pseudolycoriella hygida]
MVLRLLGTLIEPTDRYSTKSHRISAIVLTTIIKIVVSSFMPASFVTFCYLAYNYHLFYMPPTTPGTSQQWLLLTATIWSLLEIGFYLYCLNVKRRFSHTSSTLELTWEKRVFYVQRVLDHNPTVFKSLAKWFHKRDELNVEDDIYLEHFEDWLSWAFFNKMKSNLTNNEMHELHAIMDMCLKRDPSVAAMRNENGRSRKPLEFMRLNLDPIAFQHKPLIAYLVISLMQLYGLIFLYFIGFTHYNCQPRSTLSYWIYNGNKSNGTKPPVFLVYGIGIGVTMYLKVINAIKNKDPDRTIVVLDLPHISLKLVHQIPSLTQTLEAIDNIFKKHDLTACSWLGHSYGSIVTAWVIKSRPAYVHKVNLVDPACFALWEPDLIRNFLYNSNPIGPIHHLAQYFVAKDLLVASTLFRHFWWLHNILFPDDLACESYVYFSQYDWIIDSFAIKNYLDRFCSRNSWNRLKTVMMDNVAHGGFISSDEKIQIVLEHV